MAASRANWWVYILRCADGSLYTGITTDLGRRCQRHNDGKASRYTRSRRPIKLVYQEGCATRSLALKREAAVKSLSRQEKLLLIRQARIANAVKEKGPPRRGRALKS
jgi:predicted GIY-YIG superfamily endonuclease